MDTRTLTISPIYDRNGSRPYIRLKGDWLQQAGFNIDSAVTVTVEYGKLIITPKGANNGKDQL